MDKEKLTLLAILSASIMILVWVVVFVGISGCATPNAVKGDTWWEWETGRLYYSYPKHWTCGQRVADESRQLLNAYEEHDICYGLYKGKEHVWIEWHGLILDPSIGKVIPGYYKLTRRSHRVPEIGK